MSLLRRLAVAAATLALVSALVFVVVDALADRAALDLGRAASPEALAARRALLGLDRPWGTRLVEHVFSAMSLDLGVSARRGVPVREVLGGALGPTLAYALPGFVLATVVAIAAGLRAGWRGGAFDRCVLAVSTVLMSTSGVIVVVMGQYWLAHRLRLFPVLGWPLGGDGRGVVGFVVLPALLWAAIQVGADVRHYRAVFVRELVAPHLEGLRARGVGERRIVWHVLRGAAAPILGRILSRLPHVVLGGVVVEHVFNIPGVGALLVAAIREADLAVVQGIAFVLAAATIAGQMVCDGLAAWIDPAAAAAVGGWPMRQVGAGLAIAGLVMFVGLALAAGAGWIAAVYEAPVGPEYLAPGPGAWLGTDALGRDLLARAIQGARVSLAVGSLAACGMVAIGAGLGGLAGMRGGWTDRGLVAVTNAFAAVPPLVTLLAAAMIVGPGLTTAALAIACTQWTGVFRSVRAEALRLRSSDHDRASVAMGAGWWLRVRWHLVPQLRPVLITAVVLGFVYAVKVEAVLAYFGASTPTLPSWGRMLAESGSELARGIWWPTLAASVPLALLVLCAQVLADRLARTE